ncbi:hypothetical protein AAHC03_0442 [Spirometra sp. Aus1]
MDGVIVIFVNILISSSFISSAKKFSDILSHYEIINNPDLSRNYSNLRFLDVRLQIFGKDLTIHLSRTLSNFDKNALQIHLPDNDPFDTTNIALPDFFKGHVIEITSSSAYAHVNPKGEFSATLILSDSVIIIEPLTVYQQDSSDGKLIVYRLNDVRNFNFSSADDIFPSPPSTHHTNPGAPVWRRTHRSLPEKRKLCGLHFIADYSFFSNIGRRDHAKTVDILIKTFNRVNEIFLSTVFYDEDERPVTGYGFYLKGITIESISSGAFLDKLSPRKLLHTFSQRSFGEACLIHLFTYSPNLFGVLGMSWMASPAMQHLGGVCSPPSVADAEVLAANTGFTSFSDSDGTQVLSSLAELVTAHELGHSLGAPHDPNTAECSPSAAEGGKFLMYTYAVSGYSPNNYLFSPCSRRAMSKVLLSKAPLCFEEEVGIPMNQCGNSRVDPGEECDPGRSVTSDCCTTSCKLRAGAQCSPLNHNCCTRDCQIAPRGTLCAETSAISTCLEPGVCDGEAPTCPGPSPSSSTRCHEHGYCDKGVCAPFCSSLGLPTCICDNAGASCLICCVLKVKIGDQVNQICQPIVIPSPNTVDAYKWGDLSRVDSSQWEVFNLTSDDLTLSGASGKQPILFIAPLDFSLTASSAVSPETKPLHKVSPVGFSVMLLDDDRPCSFGYCNAGVCKESNFDRVARLWPWFTYFAESQWTVLLWDNLVIVVILLSLSIWIPCSVLVSHLDKKLSEAHNQAVKECQLFFTTSPLAGQPSYPK